MRRRSWVVGLSLAFAACYEVGDLREQDDAGSGGSANSSGSGGGWSATGGVGGVGGGTSGSGGGTPEDAASEQPGSGGASGAGGAVQDAGSDDAGAKDAGAKDADASPPDPWHACKPLGYYGECLDDEVVIYFNQPNDCGTPPTNTCVVNICSKENGACKKPPEGCGHVCEPALGEGQADQCLLWGTNGRCVANAAIRANATGTDCEFKDCTKLGKTCTGGISVPADCI